MDNNVSQNLQSLFAELENFVSTKSVVGEPMKVGEITIIPLVDVSFGVAASAAEKNKQENNGAGGLGAKVSPTAMMVVNGTTVEIINLKEEDGIAKLAGMVPNILKKFKNLADDKTDKKESTTTKDGE